MDASHSTSPRGDPCGRPAVLGAFPFRFRRIRCFGTIKALVRQPLIRPIGRNLSTFPRGERFCVFSSLQHLFIRQLSKTDKHISF